MSTKTFRIAVFRRVTTGDEVVFQCYDEEQTNFAGHPRVSEIVQIVIPMLPAVDTAAIEVGILDDEIQRVTATFAKQLDALKTRKAELLALTHDEPEIDDRADCPIHGLQDGPDCVRC